MKRIPLEPKDIPPGSCIRNHFFTWISISAIVGNKVCLHTGIEISCDELMEMNWEIYHPIIYPNWAPCYKEVEI